MEKENQKPPGSFKLDHTWPEEEGFKKLVIQNWKRFEPNLGESTVFQFVENLKQIKKSSGSIGKEEIPKRKKRSDRNKGQN